MNDYDLRQFMKMHQQINLYCDGSVQLNTLINDLIFLRDALLEVEQEWEHEFTNCVVDLESVYSYMLEKNTGELDSMAQKIVDNAISKMLSLLKLTD